VAGQLRGNDLVLLDATPPGGMKPLGLAGLEACGVPEELFSHRRGI